MVNDKNPWSHLGTFLIDLEVPVKGVDGGGDFLARNEDYWQTPTIHNFAQLNWLLHETQGECTYGAYITHRGPREPPTREPVPPKGPPEAQNGYE